MVRSPINLWSNLIRTPQTPCETDAKSLSIAPEIWSLKVWVKLSFISKFVSIQHHCPSKPPDQTKQIPTIAINLFKLKKRKQIQN